MGNWSSDRLSSWNDTTPQSAAQSLVAHYGGEARNAARHCLEAARAVGREKDLRFWQAVLEEMSCGEGPTRELQDNPIAIPIPTEWRGDDFLRRIGPESTPLDASILAALTLKNPQERLHKLEAQARCEGRRAEEHFWQRAQQLLVAILTPSNEPEETSERPAVH